ncbi:hypothetical protein Ciccas_005915 [Cichlidogyrus casuarinus]|uniref:G-protein coupled receptors family 1 profile domain-containing protein n=1 Tax=Cichlidogyrus casuarinus TaxID=1844966 RepID=A0ABD2QB02_9PLAT
MIKSDTGDGIQNKSHELEVGIGFQIPALIAVSLIFVVSFIGNTLVAIVLLNNLKFPFVKRRKKAKRIPIIYSVKQTNNNAFIYETNSKPLTIYQPDSCSRCQEACQKSVKKRKAPVRSAKQLASSSLAESSSIKSLLYFNLCLADFLTIFAKAPILFFYDILDYQISQTMVSCKLLGFLPGTITMVSSFTHVAISMDRFIIIFYPFRQRISYWNACLVVSAIWILAGCMVGPHLIVNNIFLNTTSNLYYCDESWHIFSHTVNISNSSEVEIINDNGRRYFSVLVFLTQYVIPLLVICGTYSAIITKMKLRRSPGELNMNRQSRMVQAESKELIEENI